MTHCSHVFIPLFLSVWGETRFGHRWQADVQQITQVTCVSWLFYSGMRGLLIPQSVLGLTNPVKSLVDFKL